jgi:hypothetical protein
LWQEQDRAEGAQVASMQVRRYGVERRYDYHKEVEEEGLL